MSVARDTLLSVICSGRVNDPVTTGVEVISLVVTTSVMMVGSLDTVISDMDDCCTISSCVGEHMIQYIFTTKKQSHNKNSFSHQ